MSNLSNEDQWSKTAAEDGQFREDHVFAALLLDILSRVSYISFVFY